MPPQVTMLLCDAAQQQGGKLYILGGGWTTINFQQVPFNMALAIKLAIPQPVTRLCIVLPELELFEIG